MSNALCQVLRDTFFFFASREYLVLNTVIACTCEYSYFYSWFSIHDVIKCHTDSPERQSVGKGGERGLCHREHSVILDMAGWL